MGSEKQRKSNIEYIENTMKAAKAREVGVSRKKLAALCSLKFGVTRRKANEYIQTFIDAEMILITESGDMCWSED